MHVGSQVFLAANVLAFWYGSRLSDAPWLAAAFYIWVNCYGVIAPVQAWTFANRVFDTRQARRLFGLVGAGASVGAIVGGLMARELVGRVGGAVNLMLVLAVLILSGAVIVGIGWQARRPARPHVSRPTARFADTLVEIARTPYLRNLSLLVMFVAIVTQWIAVQLQRRRGRSLLRRRRQPDEDSSAPSTSRWESWRWCCSCWSPGRRCGSSASA